MRLIFVRHAEAEGHHLKDELADYFRLLTKEGKKSFKKRVKRFSSEYEHIDVIYSSALLRSIKTASILYKKFKSADFEFLPELDFLSDPQDLVHFIQQLTPNKTYAFIGHEPHLSKVCYIMWNKEIQQFNKGEIRVFEFNS